METGDVLMKNKQGEWRISEKILSKLKLTFFIAAPVAPFHVHVLWTAQQGARLARRLGLVSCIAYWKSCEWGWPGSLMSGLFRGEKCHAAEISNHVRANFDSCARATWIRPTFDSYKGGTSCPGGAGFPIIYSFNNFFFALNWLEVTQKCFFDRLVLLLLKSKGIKRSSQTEI